MKLFLGIDPGVSGAWAVVDENAKLVDFHLNEKVGKVVDVQGIAQFILRNRERITRAALEQVGARPGQGVSTMFKFGRMYGLAEGFLAGLQIPYQLVTPHQWAKTMHQGVEGRDDMPAKQCSHVAAMRLFPDVDWRPSTRHQNPHEGKIDAALLAEYCRRKFFSTEN